MRIFIIFFFLSVLILGCSDADAPSERYVVMLSMDGFRWDYARRVPTPNLDRIAGSGVVAESLKPSFPTKTFPNHYSMATGLYPDHHGIVLNSFYDEPSGRYYAIADREAVEDGYFYGGEPIWVTAERQGVITGSYFWVGSEAEIGGYRPTYTKRYDEGFPYAQRIDSVIAWLQKPAGVRPRLILWYFDEPDHTGHVWGPESAAVDSVVMYLDSLVGVFLDRVGALPIADRINVIVTSDHGMGGISDDRKVVLGNCLDMEWVEELQGYNPNFNIKARAGFADSIHRALSGVEGIRVWKTPDLPPRLHYGTHPRTCDLVVVADSGWSVVAGPDDKVGRGAHGFDNANTDMHAIFYACGPAFRKNYVAPTFENVDLYPLICEILGLQPSKVDGDLRHVEDMLLNPKKQQINHN